MFEDLADTIEKNVCDESPDVLLMEVLKETLVLLTIYTLFTTFSEHRLPHAENVALFLSVWVPSYFSLKVFSCQWAEQLPRVAAWTLAAKYVGLLSS
jgi:hypothetical protein